MSAGVRRGDRLASPQPLSALAARLTDGHDGGPPDREVGARWQRLRDAEENRRGLRRPRRGLGLWAGVGLGAAALATLAIFVWLRWQGPPLTFAMAGGSSDGDGHIVGVGMRPASLTFSEGTKVALEPGSRAVVVSTDRRGARVRLEDGRARFAVVHRPRARWAVDAGPFTVDVTGTAFDVRWSGSDDRLEVRLLVGSVKVRGPLTGGGVALQAGDTFEARLRQGVMRIERGPSGAAWAPAPAPASASASAPVRESTPAPAPVQALSAPVVPPAPSRAQTPRTKATTQVADAPSSNVGRSWRQRVASGDFRSVLDEAEEHGLSACLRELPVDRLAALADAARYVGRADIATDALQAQRRRFVDSSPAHKAAFLLGRLAEESGDPAAVAVRWYETYLTEEPSGSYAGAALGRKMLLLARGARASAVPAAREYLDRFPAGAYAVQAQELAADGR